MVYRSFIKEKNHKKVWGIAFNNCLKAGEPKLFAVCGGARCFIYECSSKGDIKLVKGLVDPVNSCYHRSILFSSSIFWALSSISLSVRRRHRKSRRLLYLLLDSRFEEKTICSDHRWLTWCNSHFTTRTKWLVWNGEVFDWPWSRNQSTESVVDISIFIGIGEHRYFHPVVEHRNRCLYRNISRWTCTSSWCCYHRL